MASQNNAYQMDPLNTCVENAVSSSQRGSALLEAQHGHGSPFRSSLALQLEDKATPNLLQCPLCTYTNVSLQKLQEHVNRQHLDLMSPGITTQEQISTSDEFSCPLCVCKMSSAEELELHVNLDHSDILSPQKVKLSCFQTYMSKQLFFANLKFYVEFFSHRLLGGIHHVSLEAP